ELTSTGALGVDPSPATPRLKISQPSDPAEVFCAHATPNPWPTAVTAGAAQSPFVALMRNSSERAWPLELYIRPMMSVVFRSRCCSDTQATRKLPLLNAAIAGLR